MKDAHAVWWHRGRPGDSWDFMGYVSSMHPNMLQAVADSLNEKYRGFWFLKRTDTFENVHCVKLPDPFAGHPS
jgi:hypothetical protein